MNTDIENLVKRARSKHGRISPCGNDKTFIDCLTILDDKTLCLWYNTPDGSTHVVTDERFT